MNSLWGRISRKKKSAAAFEGSCKLDGQRKYVQFDSLGRNLSRRPKQLINQKNIALKWDAKLHFMYVSANRNSKYFARRKASLISQMDWISLTWPKWKYLRKNRFRAKFPISSPSIGKKAFKVISRKIFHPLCLTYFNLESHFI